MRRKRQRLEVYRLIEDKYVLQPGDLIWMPEINLGIGHERGTHQGLTREWLYWYDQNGNKYSTPEEVTVTQQQQLQQTQQQLQQTQQQLQELLKKLQQRGIDPHNI